MFTSVYDDTASPPVCSTQVGTHNLCSSSLPTGAKVQWTYADAAHPYYPTTVTDAQGNQVTTHYTPAGNPDTITDQLPSQNQTQVVYNANGTVDHVIDARSNTTKFTYDSAGNLRQITPPPFTPGTGSQALGPTLIVPDAVSRVSSVTDGKNQQRTYTYDTLDRTTALSYSADTAGNVSFSPDADGNVTQMTDSNGATTYAYDARNRQTQKTLPASLGGGSMTYGYDGVNNLTSFTDTASVPGTALAVAYGYNPADLVTSLAENGKTTSFGFDANHRRTSTTYPDGVVMSQTYDNSGRLSTIAGVNGATTLTSFGYSYTKPGGGDTALPYAVSETLTSPAPNSVVTQATVANSYDQLNRLTKWLVTKSDTSILHSYRYQFDGVSNRTQIIADPKNSAGQIVSDPSLGVAHSNENDLVFNAASELDHIVAYGAAGTNPSTSPYYYDPAGNQTGNDTLGSSQTGLRIQYQGTNQTQSITNDPTHGYVPVGMTFTGPGQSERVKRSWTVNGTAYTSSYTYSLLGLSGYTSNGIGLPGATSSVTSFIVRDPFGTPIAQRYSNGQEYYYLYNGQGDVVALEDPGTIVQSYDFCPTGNEADLGGITPMTTVGLANPIRQGGVAYDDDTKLYVGPNGFTADYNGTGTQLNYLSTQIFTPTEAEALGVAIPECNALDTRCLYGVVHFLSFEPYTEYYFAFKFLSIAGFSLPEPVLSLLLSVQAAGLSADMALDYAKNQIFHNGEPVYDEGYTGPILGTGTNSMAIYLPGAEIYTQRLFI